MAMESIEILKSIGIQGGVASQTMEDGGTIRMKILVKKQELEQVLERLINKRGDNKENRIKGNNLQQLSKSSASKSLESLLKEVKKTNIVNENQVE